MKLHTNFKWPYPIIFGPENIRMVSSSSSISTTEELQETCLTSILDLMSVKLDDNSSLDSQNIPLTLSSTGTIENIGGLFNKDNCLTNKVFEKLCKKTQTKATLEAERELNYMICTLLNTDALEWIYFLCILRQDLKILNDKLREEMSNQKRINTFLKNVQSGTKILIDWAETKCPSYIPTIKAFNEFIS